MNVPKLRFKEFTDEWNYTCLSEISAEITYGMNSASTEFDGLNKYIRITDIDDETGNFKPSNLVSPLNKPEDKFLVKKDDILFARTGASTGKTYLYNIKDGKLYFAGFLIKAHIVNHNSNFIFQQTKLEKYKKWVKLTSMRSGQPGINSEEYGKCVFSITSLSEENKIAQFLSLLDKKIELQTKKIEALKLFKKGLLKTEYNKIKNKHLYQLSNIAEIYQPQTLSQKQLENGIYPVFGANGIIGFHSSFNHTSSQITISCRGENAGSINKTPENCWINGNSMVINVDNNQNIDKDYLKIVLESQNLKYLISGSGQPQIIRTDIAKHKIPIISIDKQLLYIKKFNLLDSKLLLEIAKLKNLNLLKKGFMQSMFV